MDDVVDEAPFLYPRIAQRPIHTTFNTIHRATCKVNPISRDYEFMTTLDRHSRLPVRDTATRSVSRNLRTYSIDRYAKRSVTSASYTIGAKGSRTDTTILPLLHVWGFLWIDLVRTGHHPPHTCTKTANWRVHDMLRSFFLEVSMAQPDLKPQLEQDGVCLQYTDDKAMQRRCCSLVAAASCST